MFLKLINWALHSSCVVRREGFGKYNMIRFFKSPIRA